MRAESHHAVKLKGSLIDACLPWCCSVLGHKSYENAVKAKPEKIEGRKQFLCNENKSLKVGYDAGWEREFSFWCSSRILNLDKSAKAENCGKLDSKWLLTWEGSLGSVGEVERFVWRRFRLALQASQAGIIAILEILKLVTGKLRKLRNFCFFFSLYLFYFLVFF